MKLREIKIRNFRNLENIYVPIDDTTVLVGENNAGKTALLDALRFALPRTGFGRINPFNEYDYHMASTEDSPQTSNGIIIELWFREDKSGEWPPSIIQVLSEIVQTDPIKDINSIGLRLTSKYEEVSKQFILNREFLNLQGAPLAGKAQSPAMVSRFLDFIRLFYLSALRDSDTEFSPRSQFWGKILRDLKIKEEDRKELCAELNKLNNSLLKADARLNQVRESLENIQKVVTAGGTTSIQPLPLQPWDLMSKSQVVIRGQGTNVDFPLSRHGQGIQSLAVLFLFQAYIDVLLKPTFQKETVALLALEEPEAHLHPQAIRALTKTIDKLKTQKIISTHSPYVLQGLPIKNIRLFRYDGITARVFYVKRCFEAKMPSDQKLINFCNTSRGKYDFHEGSSTLSVHGKIEDKEYRKILPIYSNGKKAQTTLKQLKEESKWYISDEDIADLDTYAKRIRGEVFFARAWLLCEGQSEFLLLQYFAELLGNPFDQAGVTVIDFQNNGSPGAFIALARNFDIPWILLCDNDCEGEKFVRTLKKLLDSGDNENDLLRPLPENDTDLELFLVKNGFLHHFMSILWNRDISLKKNPGDVGFEEEIVEQLRKNKTEYTNELIRNLHEAGANKDCVPPFFEKAIQDIIKRAN